jgi:hypothetical protein
MMAAHGVSMRANDHDPRRTVVARYDDDGCGMIAIIIRA